jgi:hypothetical protein
VKKIHFLEKVWDEEVFLWQKTHFSVLASFGFKIKGRETIPGGVTEDGFAWLWL